MLMHSRRFILEESRVDRSTVVIACSSTPTNEVKDLVRSCNYGSPEIRSSLGCVDPESNYSPVIAVVDVLDVLLLSSVELVARLNISFVYVPIT